MGHDVQVINYLQSPDIGKNAKRIRCIVGKICSALDYSTLYRFRYAFLRFQNDYMNLTSYVLKENLGTFTKQYDCLVCGSDQIWAPNVLDQSYMLNFCDGKKIRKISYAASIGLPTIPVGLIPSYQKNLHDFYRISVREEQGKSILQKIAGINAAVVLDPTLLIPCNQYMRMEQSLPIATEPYIFCYFLNKDHNYKERVLRYASNKDLRIIGVSSRESDNVWMKTLGTEVGPSEFLYLIHHADTIFTDSYHGTVFSLIYHKEFYTFERFMDNDPINQNSRIYQLDKWFGIEKHIVGYNQMIKTNESYNFESFETKLEEAKEISLNFLKEALD